MPTINSLSVLVVHGEDPSKPDKSCVPCCVSSQHDERQYHREAAAAHNLMLLQMLAVLEVAFLPFLFLCLSMLPAAKPTSCSASHCTNITSNTSRV